MKYSCLLIKLAYVDQKSSRKGCRATKRSKIFFRSTGKRSKSKYRWHWFQSTWGVYYPVNKRGAAMAMLQVSIRGMFHITALFAGPPRKNIPSLTNKTTIEILGKSEGTMHQRFPKCAPRNSRDKRPVLRGSVDKISAVAICNLLIL
jgi:hypothetical protein